MSKPKFDKNGLPLSYRGTTCYKDVYFGGAGWQHAGQEVYVAIAGLSPEEAEIAGKDTFMFHLSKHDNVLDAAYVAMKFNEDRENNVRRLKGVKTGYWECAIPKFEFEPEDTEKARALRIKIKSRGEQNATVEPKVKSRKAGTIKVDAVTSANVQVQTYAKFATSKAGLAPNVSGLVYKIVSDRKFDSYDAGKTFVDAVIANAKKAA